MSNEEERQPSTAQAGGYETAPSGEAEASVEPEFKLDTEGKIRYMWMRLGTAIFRERVPLHYYKMSPDKQKFHYSLLARKLEAQLIRDMRKSK